MKHFKPAVPPDVPNPAHVWRQAAKLRDAERRAARLMKREPLPFEGMTRQMIGAHDSRCRCNRCV